MFIYSLKLHSSFADILWNFKSISQTATNFSAMGVTTTLSWQKQKLKFNDTGSGSNVELKVLKLNTYAHIIFPNKNKNFIHFSALNLMLQKCIEKNCQDESV